MTQNKPTDLHSQVSSSLAEGSLHDAFSKLSGALIRQSDPALRDLLKKQEETYKYMIHYFVEGIPDSERGKMLSDITACLYFINDSVKRNEVIIDSPDIYSSTLRFERIRRASLASRLAAYRKAASTASLAIEAGGDLEAQKEADEALLALFSYVWTMFGAPKEDYKVLADSIKDPDLPFEYKAQVISALMLGNLSWFDRKGLSCLLDIFEADINPRLSARALVAIVMVVAAHPERIARDKQLEARFSLWQDSIIIYRQLREVVMSIIRAHDTERISSKMQNEVIPELMKLRPEILNKLRNFSEIQDLDMLEVNPEWEDLMNKNGLGEKLKELTEMQMEGGDVMMMAFSNLKTFPFFNSVANWFLPFSATHHEVSSSADQSADFMSQIFDMQGVMCDSDKYSFAFSLSRMPEDQRKTLSQKMNEQMAQIKEAIDEKQLKSSGPEFDAEVTRFVRDLYRFFKLFRKKSDFYDPFARPLDFNSLPFLSEILNNEEILNLVGEFYFKRGYYAEALPILLYLDAEKADDSLLWEKIGYSYHAQGNLAEAVKWYKKAELLHPDSTWLIKKLALCCRLLNKTKEAAQYYSRALEKDPDNYPLLMSAGNCLLENEDFKGALSHYYHADYAKPGNIATWRAIAWAELLSGNLEKSRANYDRIIESTESGPTDLLNSGHVFYLSRQLKDAAESYRRAALHSGYGLESLEKDILQDMKVIERLGGSRDELALIIDKVKYDLGK